MCPVYISLSKSKSHKGAQIVNSKYKCWCTAASTVHSSVPTVLWSWTIREHFTVSLDGIDCCDTEEDNTNDLVKGHTIGIYFDDLWSDESRLMLHIPLVGEYMHCTFRGTRGYLKHIFSCNHKTRNLKSCANEIMPCACWRWLQAIALDICRYCGVQALILKPCTSPESWFWQSNFWTGQLLSWYVKYKMHTSASGALPTSAYGRLTVRRSWIQAWKR